MSSPTYRVRRATLDDLQQLTALWSSMNFNAEGMTKKITEFQVAETAEGTLLGAVGLQITERQGLIHSEAFKDFALAEQLRPLLWDRIHTVATNMGLLRIWTHEQAPFWNHCGLVRADAPALEKLPPQWRRESTDWLTLKLREELDAIAAMDAEFALFLQTERQRSERTLHYAKLFKTIATIIAFVAAGLALAAAFYLFQRNPSLLHR